MNPFKLKQLSLIVRNCLIGFTVLCAFTYIFLKSSDKVTEHRMLASTDTVEVQADYRQQVFKLHFKAHLEQGNNNTWSYYSFDILDKNKDYEYTFDRDFWKASGYDDGYWYEEDIDMTYHIVRKQKGKFYIALSNPENDTFTDPPYLKITVSSQRGSSLAFLITGIISLLGIFLFDNVAKELPKYYSKDKVYYE